MTYDPRFHHRQTHRLRGYDYTRAGVYFVTLVAQHRECLFGEVRSGKMILNERGAIAAECWMWLGQHHARVELDEWIVMPNHLHGIVVIHDRTSGAEAWPSECARKPLGRLIGAFKTVSSKQINLLQGTPGTRIWQRDFHDRIVRDASRLEFIRRYIQSNPKHWSR